MSDEPREVRYYEVASVKGIEAEIERLRADLDDEKMLYERLKHLWEVQTCFAQDRGAEIERLRAELGKTADQLQWANDERGRLEAEIDRLQTEIIILDASLSGSCKTILEKCVEIERLRAELAEWERTGRKDEY